VTPLTGDELLRLPVKVRGIKVGRVVDVLLHPTEPRALGADVLCGDDRHRFLPFPAARVEGEAFELTSPLVLLDLRDDSFYRLEARALSELRGIPLDGGSPLQDVIVGPGWAIEELVLGGPEGPRRVALDGVVLPPHGARRRRLSRPRRRGRLRRRSR
jgi:hypothetical protein